MSSGICKGPAQSAHLQSDQDLRCPLTERAIGHYICINGDKCPDKTLAMREMNLNRCILRMIEDNFFLGAAHI